MSRPHAGGRILAATNDGKLFDWALEISAAWADDASGCTIESAIRDTRAASGGARLTIEGTVVSLIAFQDSIESDGGTFSGPTGSKVVYLTGAEQFSTDHSGQFIGEVGRTSRGPGQVEGGSVYILDQRPIWRGPGRGTVADGMVIVAAGGNTQWQPCRTGLAGNASAGVPKAALARSVM